MNIIDSSGWLEYFSDGPNAPFFSRPLQKTADIVVPTITIYEVFKVVLRQRNESDALQSVALMQQGSVVDLTSSISILAAKISIEQRLPMADSIISCHRPCIRSDHMDSGFRLQGNRWGSVYCKEKRITTSSTGRGRKWG